jgi:hypothetical protein
MLRGDGALFVSIDKLERTILQGALDLTFGAKNRVEELIWTQSTANSQLPTYSTNHEYVEVYARSLDRVVKIPQMFREPKPGFFEIKELLDRLGPEFPPVEKIQSELSNLFSQHLLSYREEWEAQGEANGMPRRRGKTHGEASIPMTEQSIEMQTVLSSPSPKHGPEMPQSGYGVQSQHLRPRQSNR